MDSPAKRIVPFADYGVVDREEARDRPHGRALAGAIGAEQRDDAPCPAPCSDTPCTATMTRL
jgi:hypothetical protein